MYVTSVLDHFSGEVKLYFHLFNDDRELCFRIVRTGNTRVLPADLKPGASCALVKS